MASISIIRAQVEDRIPGALRSYQRVQPEVLPTGITVLDEEIGGLPKGALTQVWAPQNASLGRTTLLVSILAHLTGSQECCALIDASDCFDPRSSAAAGVDLSRMLWVRCGKRRRLSPLEQAFKAADVLLQNGGFGLVAMDLASFDEQSIRKVPLTTWFRFARVVERMPTALLVLTSYPAAKSCARLTLRLTEAEDQWANPETIYHARIFSHLSSEIEVGQARASKPVQSARNRFRAAPIWA
jgi:recombination protein RecA